MYVLSVERKMECAQTHMAMVHILAISTRHAQVTDGIYNLCEGFGVKF